METRAVNIRRLVGPLLVSILFVVTTTLAWRAFNGPVPLEPRSYTAEVPLEDARDLYPGSAVQISGVDIGAVAKIERDDDAVQAVLEVEPEFAPLGSEARFIPRTKSLLGEGYVEIAPGSADAGAIPEDGEIEMAQVKDAQGLDAALRIVGPDRRAAIRRLFSGAARAFEGRAEDLNASLGSAETLAVSSADLLAEIDGQRQQLRRLISRSGDVFEALGRNEGELAAVIRAGDQVFSATAERDVAIRQTVRALPGFVTTLEHASRTISETRPDLVAAAATLNAIAPKVGPALGAVVDSTPAFTRTFRKLDPVLAAGERGVPSLRGILEAVGPSFAAFYPALRELNPTLDLLALVRDSAVANFANVAQTTNAVYIAPDGSRAATTSATPTIWNESIVGWKKKLPSNRPNPYPAPGSALSIAEGGLKAYDCRHTENVQYLPPLGTGAPPCILQGPWKFKGESRYFPRLKRADP